MKYIRAPSRLQTMPLEMLTWPSILRTLKSVSMQ